MTGRFKSEPVPIRPQDRLRGDVKKRTEERSRLFYGVMIMVVGLSLVAVALIGSGMAFRTHPAITVAPPMSVTATIGALPSPGTQIHINWVAGQANVTNFTVRIGYKGCYQWIAIFSTASSSTSYSMLTQPETLYCVGVAEWSGGTMSAWSSPVSVVTGNFFLSLPVTKIGAPYGLSVQSTSTSSIALAWTNPQGPTQPICLNGCPQRPGVVNDTIYYGATCGNWTNAVSLAGVFPFHTLTLSTGPYCFTIQAWSPYKNSIGPGGGSYFSGTQVASVGGVVGLLALGQTSNSVFLGWVNPTGVTIQNDTIEYATSIALLGTPFQHFISAGSVVVFNVTGLQPSTLYAFRVYATVGGSPTPKSNVVTATTGGSPGTVPPGGGGGQSGGAQINVPPVGGAGVSIPIPTSTTGSSVTLNVPFVVVGAVAGLGGFLVILTTNPSGGHRWWGAILIMIGILVAIFGTGTVGA